MFENLMGLFRRKQKKKETLAMRQACQRLEAYGIDAQEVRQAMAASGVSEKEAIALIEGKLDTYLGDHRLEYGRTGDHGRRQRGDADSDFATSFIVGGISNNAFIGAAVGGSLLGGIAGDMASDSAHCDGDSGSSDSDSSDCGGDD